MRRNELASTVPPNMKNLATIAALRAPIPGSCYRSGQLLAIGIRPQQDEYRPHGQPEAQVKGGVVKQRPLDQG